MARVAEMGVSPAEPLGNRTAKFALELNKVKAMSLAVGNPTTDSFCSTFSADQFFWFEV